MDDFSTNVLTFIHIKLQQLWMTSVQTFWLYTYKTRTTLDDFSTNVLTLYIQNTPTLDNFSTNVLTIYIQNSNNFGWLRNKRVDFIHTKLQQLWMTSEQTCWLYTYKTQTILDDFSTNVLTLYIQNLNNMQIPKTKISQDNLIEYLIQELYVAESVKYLDMVKV